MKKLGVLGVALLVAMGLALAAGPAAFASTAVHCPPTGTDDLQAAMNSAPAGSQILIYGTCTGNFTVPKDLTLVGENAVLDGNNSGTVLTVPAGVTAVVDYLTIQHGDAGQGGGILNEGTLTLNSATVSNNNLAGGGDGAGIFNDHGTLTLRSSTVADNSTQGGSGGGVFNNIGTINVVGSSISNNRASEGGGFFNEGTLTISSSTVSGNVAFNGDGGGILNEFSQLTLKSSTVTGNSASMDGGGIWTLSPPPPTLRGTAISGNSPDDCVGC